jgi:hypothetical protein
MSKRGARRLVVVTFVLYTLALTWPGVLPFNRIRPFILGLPFSFFWVILWVVLGGLSLWVADSAYARSSEEQDNETPHSRDAITDHGEGGAQRPSGIPRSHDSEGDL